MKNQYTCEDCDAVYTIEHDMDERAYRVQQCSFCGAEIDPELVDEYDMDDMMDDEFDD